MQLIWDETPLEVTVAIVLNVTVSQIIFLKGKRLFIGIDSSLFDCSLQTKFSCRESTNLTFLSPERIESSDVY